MKAKQKEKVFMFKIQKDQFVTERLKSSGPLTTTVVHSFSNNESTDRLLNLTLLQDN